MPPNGLRARAVITLTLLLSLWCGGTLCFQGEFLNEGEDITPDEIPNLSNNEEELEILRDKMVDPHGSWMTFVKYSARANRPKRTRKRHRKKSSLQGPQGPQGPAGPPGPPGPPGSPFTREELMEELKELIKEVAEKKAMELVAEMCSVCNITKNSTSKSPDATSDVVTLVPRIAAGFHMRLSGNIEVSRRTFKELKNFQQPFGGGAFQRGDVFNSKEGRFEAPRDGIYQFTSNLHIRVRTKRKPGGEGGVRRHESVKIMICIDSKCKKYSALETVAGLDTNSKIFTVTATGFLELKEKQYVSVYVDNSSGINIKVQAGSEFIGLLIGT